MHRHDHAAATSSAFEHRGRLGWALALTLAYMLAEALGGLWTGSLALLADAGHMLSDAAALALSLFAVRIARRPPTPERTFGFYRTEILAAAVNGATLVAISVFIALEAYERWRQPVEILGLEMMWIAAGGLAVNLVSLRILAGGRGQSLNLQGAWLHVLTDALGSVQAIVAGLLIWRYGWHWVDPLASILIALLVVYSAWSLLNDSVAVLMEGTPAHIDIAEVRSAIAELPGVQSVHDLHVWTITSGLESLSAHVVCSERPRTAVLTEIRETLARRFGIEHQTIQLEPEDFDEDHPLDCR
jgi:cobalt-zinc-cadmium efflux system protein